MTYEAAKEIIGSVELATFYVGEALCGMDILKVQEINKLMEMTRFLLILFSLS